MDLFADQRAQARRAAAPLAERMRPRRLEEFAGQQHFLGEGMLLRRLLLADRLHSAIFFGPPGCGKTSLAQLIAQHTSAAFASLHAAEAGVKEVRQVLDAAAQRLAARGQRTVLFLDEIHRFSRAQQDVLLRDVEQGVIILIGATTENPFFAVNGPLLSRSQLFEFQALTPQELVALLQTALRDAERGLGALGAAADDDALELLAQRADGDARRALSGLEIAVLSQAAVQAGTVRVTRAAAAESLQRHLAQHDCSGDAHYDITSAFIKSMRGSAADAALYWLARLLEGGEDPLYVARRIAILAGEDIGLADPQASVMAAAALQITTQVGMPECQYALAQAALYMARAPKSDAVKRAIRAAREDVRSAPPLSVPDFLRDASYRGAERLGRGQGYVSPHGSAGGHQAQDYLGASRRYYQE